MSGPNPPENEGAGLPGEEPGSSASGPETSETDMYSQAYSAPESEQFTSGPYVPADSSLYDYDSYETPEVVEQAPPPRWPWVVGVAAIIAAIALVASVSVLVTRTDTDNLADPDTSTSTAPPVQDEITTTTPPPPPPPTTTEPPPPPPPPETVTVTQEPPPPPPPPPAPAEPPPPPAPETTAPPPSPPPTTTTRSGPRQVTYSVTGTKAPFDIINITYIDASGRSRTQRNVYIPWSITVTPISQSEVGSVQAQSVLLTSRLNCSITTSDGQVLSSNTNNAAQTSC
ncbi:MmpS family protein [Mycobacterium deserti]|uniref:MmpS family protein n=1 Tax=Mycobacterium deserti TaxID=2978347 RepID=A0ABT2MD61_9MYCO|nr:MmpS family protein [Mycobacterium deserti]MCT7660214.1 MmpS family protein [Mycobacterium deserti]